MTLMMMLVMGAGFCYTHGCIHIFERVRKKDVICDFLIDGQFILFGLAIFTLSATQVFP
jgi:hypothetical protein